MVKIFLITLVCALPAMAAPPRAVALTFDDLPDIAADEHSMDQTEVVMRSLIVHLRDAHAPAIGFVNEDKLDDPRGTALLAEWLDAGFDLGNHTYAHVDLNQTTVADYENDILRGETVTRPLCAARQKALHWFRHPYLDTGKTLADRDAVDQFLADHGYAVAPVTIDNSEWIFAMAYEKAASRLVRFRLRRAYVRYMASRFAWYEARAHTVFGREIKQIVLLHADTLNADALPSLLHMIRRRGYRFISIDEAMTDRAYESGDRWTGGGVSWIERWGVTRGMRESLFDGDPSVPRWVQTLAGARDE